MVQYSKLDSWFVPITNMHTVDVLSPAHVVLLSSVIFYLRNCTFAPVSLNSVQTRDSSVAWKEIDLENYNDSCNKKESQRSTFIKFTWVFLYVLSLGTLLVSVSMLNLWPISLQPL